MRVTVVDASLYDVLAKCYHCDLLELNMASLHVRNVDDEIVARLKERAAKHGRSAEAEHREILNIALRWEPSPEVDVEGWKRRAKEFRDSLKDRHHTPSEILLRESRDER